MAIDGIKILENGYDSVVSALTDISGSITPTQVAIGSSVAGLGIGGLIISKITKKRKAKRKTTKTKKRTKRGRSRDRKFRSKQKHELAYVRRKRKKGKKITRPRYKTKKSRSKKRTGKIYYTKKGQPYKIMSSGKARFVKKTKRRSKR